MDAIEDANVVVDVFILISNPLQVERHINLDLWYDVQYYVYYVRNCAYLLSIIL